MEDRIFPKTEDECKANIITLYNITKSNVDSCDQRSANYNVS